MTRTRTERKKRSRRALEYLRQLLLDRYGPQCHWCKEPFTVEKPATFDHVLPLIEGGEDEAYNIVLAHERCNNKRTNRVDPTLRPHFKRLKNMEFDFMDGKALRDLINNRYINVQKHPETELYIYNYTPKAQYERVWTPETRACRGLVLDAEYRVIARPFPKFHNLEEHSRSDIMWSKRFTVTTKLDGSLGILYPAPDGPAIATRGSFTSEQAVRATTVLREKYPEFCAVMAANWSMFMTEIGCPSPQQTYLFEIIYPSNRIVVDYGETEDLFLLAVIDNRTGADLLDITQASLVWDGPVVQSYDVSCKPRDVLAACGLPQDGSVEGIVLRFDHPKGSHTRVKVKTDEYKRLHRIVTGVSTKTVWENLANRRPFDELLERVPDEFSDWLKNTIEELVSKFSAIEQSARTEFVQIMAQLGLEPPVPRHERGRFAAVAKTSPNAALLFKLLDGQSLDELIWKMIRPEYAKPFKVEE